jgi:hypothetical protein
MMAKVHLHRLSLVMFSRQTSDEHLMEYMGGGTVGTLERFNLSDREMNAKSNDIL